LKDISYSVTFTLIVEVNALTPEEAEDLAWDELNTTKPSSLVVAVDVEET